MRRVNLNGQSFACPFERLLPPHTAAALAALEADIARRRRVLLPVVTFVSPAHGRAILDGVTRCVLAERHDVAEVPQEDWGEMHDEAAAEACLALNVLRRQIAPKDYEEIVLTLRRRGESIRNIAGISGIPKNRVERIIGGAGMPTYPATPALFDDDEEDDDFEPLPDRVTGRDGRSYPATRPELDEEEVPTPGCKMPAGLAESAARHALERARKAAAALSVAVGELFDSPLEQSLRTAAQAGGHGIAAGLSHWPALEELREILGRVA